MIAGASYKWLVSTLLCIGIVSCSDKVESYLTQEENIISIAHLRAQLRSQATPITEDYIIEGYIVANDHYGEYYKKLIISDGTGGIEIAIDAEELYRDFPLYSSVTLNCSTLWIGDYGGRIIMGARPTGEYTVDRIPQEELSRYLRCSSQDEVMQYPEYIAINQITAHNCGNIYRIADVSFKEQSGMSWCEYDAESEQYVTTERLLYDKEGNSIPLRIPGECHYAEQIIPDGWGSIVVIVESFNGVFSLSPTGYRMHFE
ncbi:MAG: hypothetical protein J6B41_02855 [Alistipes sp.]|nr:hypothetical protein [Alistipes sp.]